MIVTCYYTQTLTEMFTLLVWKIQLNFISSLSEHIHTYALSHIRTLYIMAHGDH